MLALCSNSLLRSLRKVITFVQLAAIPYPATDWSAKQHQLLILEGVSALIDRIADDKACEQCLKRVIDSFASPLVLKFSNLKLIFEKEGRILGKEVPSFLDFIGYQRGSHP